VTIYAEKNKSGTKTGVWIVEVRKMTNGVSKTIRRRSRDYAEAKQIEDALREGKEEKVFSAPAPIRAKSNLPSVDLRPSVDRDPYSGGEVSGVDIYTLSPKIFTARDLFEGAQEIYRGQKDAKQSTARLQKALSVIGWDTPVTDIRTPALDFLVRMLRARSEMAPATINRFLYAVSGALRWAWQRELIPGVPAVPKQQEPVGRLNFLNETDQARLIKWLEEHNFKDVAFSTRVLLATGFRISEFRNLKKDNLRGEWVDLFEGTTKNDAKRSVFVGDLSEELRAFVKAGLPTYQRIAKGLSAASAALKIEPPATPHTLRHSTATTMTTAGVSLATVGKVLGHKSLSTTLRYAHVEDQALIDAAKRLGIRSKSSR